MWISRKAKVLFAHNPRTAGTSMIRVFTSVFNDFRVIVTASEDPEHVHDHEVCVPPDAEDFAIIAGVRNPFARELSFFLWRQENGSCLPNMRFKEYLQSQQDYRVIQEYTRRTFGTQSQFLEDLPAILVRYEDLPDSFYRLECLQGHSVILPRARWTAIAPYRLDDYYDDETMELVRTYAHEDFVRYGYDPTLLPSE